jgi:hypothetical protein
MAKPTTYATPICLVLTLLAIIGIVWGVINHNALIITIFLLPAVAYEAYRTEGESTRWASWVLLILIVAELVMIIFKINYDLATLANSNTAYVGGYFVPLGDVKIIAPGLMAILSLILFFRTNGKYTKWLSVIIFVSAFVIVYSLDRDIFKNLLGSNITQGLFNFSF